MHSQMMLYPVQCFMLPHGLTLSGFPGPSPYVPVAKLTDIWRIPREGAFQSLALSVCYAWSETSFMWGAQQLSTYLGFYHPGPEGTHAEKARQKGDPNLTDVYRPGEYAVEFQALTSPVRLPGVALVDVLLGRSRLQNSIVMQLTQLKTTYFTFNVGMPFVAHDSAKMPVVCPRGAYMQTWALAHTAAWVVVNHLWRLGHLGSEVHNLRDPLQLARALVQLENIRIFGLRRDPELDEDDTTAFTIHYEVI